MEPKYVSAGQGTTLQGLHAFLDVLRRLGVRRWEGKLDGDGMVVDFFETRSAQAVEMDEASAVTMRRLLEDAASAGTCGCGHDLTVHNSSGECLRGCQAAECARKQPTPADD